MTDWQFWILIGSLWAIAYAIAVGFDRQRAAMPKPEDRSEELQALQQIVHRLRGIEGALHTPNHQPGPDPFEQIIKWAEGGSSDTQSEPDKK